MFGKNCVSKGRSEEFGIVFVSKGSFGKFENSSAGEDSVWNWFVGKGRSVEFGIVSFVEGQFAQFRMV